MPYPNGQWPDHALATIPGGTAMGGNARIAKDLLPGVLGLQAAYLRRWGTPLRPTSANDGYRPYSVQERVFLQRYRRQTTGNGPFGDVRYWQGARWVRFTGASAAIPGTSNHGRAAAIDFTGLGGYGSERWSWMMSNAPRFGFTNPAWARNPDRPAMLEPWHWEGSVVQVSNYLPYLNQHGIIVPGLTLPAPIVEEYVMASREEVREDLIDVVRAEVNRPRAVKRLRGTHAVYADMGAYRRRATQADLNEWGTGFTDVSATDDIWWLPLVGRPGETYAKRGDDTGKIYTFEDGVLYHLTPSQWTDMGKVAPRTLAEDHEIWSRPVRTK